MKIAIDAGHGLYTPGKRCLESVDEAETREWMLNNKIAVKLETLLRKYDCSVIRVDDASGESDVSLPARCKTANNAGADIYISIHHNVGMNGDAGGGTQVYWYSSNIQHEIEAELLYKHIVNNTGLIGNRSNKVIKKSFYVLKNTKMAAFLIENGFMDSSTDVPIILSEAHADKTAQGILTFLIKEYDLKNKSGENNTANVNDTMQAFSVGDRVKVLKAVTYDSESFKIRHSVYSIMNVKGNRIVIGANGVVIATVNASNLKRV